MKIRFWGVRGSFAMCGTEFLRYGGNTTSIELVKAHGCYVDITDFPVAEGEDAYSAADALEVLHNEHCGTQAIRQMRNKIG